MDKLALTLPGIKEEETIQIQEPTGFKFSDGTIGDIISNLLPYVFVLAGLGLFVYLIIGGFQLLTSGGNPEKVKAAQGKITNAIIGFVIIFISYWLVRILEIILGIQILG
jgi:hypothetical protein